MGTCVRSSTPRFSSRSINGTRRCPNCAATSGRRGSRSTMSLRPHLNARRRQRRRNALQPQARQAHRRRRLGVTRAPTRVQAAWAGGELLLARSMAAVIQDLLGLRRGQGAARPVRADIPLRIVRTADRPGSERRDQPCRLGREPRPDPGSVKQTPGTSTPPERHALAHAPSRVKRAPMKWNGRSAGSGMTGQTPENGGAEPSTELFDTL